MCKCLSDRSDIVCCCSVGATGAVGKQVLLSLLARPEYAHVYSFGRRPSGVTHEKLTEEQVDFHKLLNEAPRSLRGLSGLQDSGQGAEAGVELWSGPEGEKLRRVSADTVFVTLGTTRAQAGSMPAFEVIDRGYAVAAAAAAVSPAKLASTGQRLLYCSSGGGNSGSFFPYLRSKGQTDEAMAALPYTDVTIAQPGMLLEAHRDPPRYLESAAQGIFKLVGKITDSAGAPVSQVGQAMAALGLRSISGYRQAFSISAVSPVGKGFSTAATTAQELYSKVGGSGALNRATVGNAELLKVAKESPAA